MADFVPSESAPLLDAAAVGDTDRVRQLLAAGELVDVVRPSDGSTPLLLAALGGHETTVALLLERDASPKLAKSNGATAVFAAAAADAVECVKILCAAGGDPDAANNHGVTPLQMAAAKGDLKLVQQLLSDGGKAGANAVDVDGRTAAHLACAGGHIEIAQELVLQAQADLRLRDASGTSALALVADAPTRERLRALRQ